MAIPGMTNTASPIAITGVGLVTSLGWGMKSCFNRLVAGESGAATGTWNDSPFGPQHWAGYPLPAGGPVLEAPWDDPVFSILDFATKEALGQASLDLSSVRPDRIGVVVSLSKGAVKNLSQRHNLSNQGRPVPADLFLAGPSAGAAFVAAKTGAEGPAFAPVTACASGLTSLRHATALLERGEVDMVLAGAADASLEPLMYSAFARMRSLAGPRYKDEPVRSWLKPWSRHRNGFLIGEGGAVFVLQRLADVNLASCPCPLVISRCQAGSEAFHPTRPRLTSDVLERVISRALAGQSDNHSPDMIHLHATATREFDTLEFQAVRRVLGNSAGRPWFVASKPAIGHCLGASGAVELAISCEALSRQVVPPFDPGPECEIPGPLKIPGPNAQSSPLVQVLKIVAGFGGHMEVCLIDRLKA